MNNELSQQQHNISNSNLQPTPVQQATSHNQQQQHHQQQQSDQMAQQQQSIFVDTQLDAQLQHSQMPNLNVNYGGINNDPDVGCRQARDGQTPPDMGQYQQQIAIDQSNQLIGVKSSPVGGIDEEKSQQSPRQIQEQQPFHKISSPYYVITQPWEVKQLSQAILNASKTKNTPILGVDCEGLAKNRKMQLVQVYFASKSFIIDLKAIDPFVHGFKEVMESNQIMKIFHDFCEDASALICQYNLICNFVFDTQIAHRLISDFLQHYDYRNINISLNNLLEEYLGQINSKKDEISQQMQGNCEFWEQRPLSMAMIQYAAQDVQFLPQVYEKMRRMDIFDKEIIDNVTENGKIYQCTAKLYHKILSDTRKCIGYGFINRNITDVATLNIDTYILAFIKNIQKRIIFCSLNLGVSGVIKDDESIRNIKQNRKSIGEIVKVQVKGFEKSGKVILKYVEQPLNIISQSHPPHFFQNATNKDMKTDQNHQKQEDPQGMNSQSIVYDQIREQSNSYQQNQQLEAQSAKPSILDQMEDSPSSQNLSKSNITVPADQSKPEQNQHVSSYAQNTSYNFNNNFYQNYVSNSQKQYAVKFKNDGGFSTATTALQNGDKGRYGSIVGMQVQSSDQLSFRDKQIHRVAPEFNLNNQQQIELGPNFYEQDQINQQQEAQQQFNQQQQQNQQWQNIIQQQQNDGANNQLMQQQQNQNQINLISQNEQKINGIGWQGNTNAISLEDVGNYSIAFNTFGNNIGAVNKQNSYQNNQKIFTPTNESTGNFNFNVGQQFGHNQQLSTRNSQQRGLTLFSKSNQYNQRWTNNGGGGNSGTNSQDNMAITNDNNMNLPHQIDDQQHWQNQGERFNQYGNNSGNNNGFQRYNLNMQGRQFNQENQSNFNFDQNLNFNQNNHPSFKFNNFNNNYGQQQYNGFQQHQYNRQYNNNLKQNNMNFQQYSFQNRNNFEGLNNQQQQQFQNNNMQNTYQNQQMNYLNGNNDSNLTTYSPMPTTIHQGGNTYHMNNNQHKHPMHQYSGRGLCYQQFPANQPINDSFQQNIGENNLQQINANSGNNEQNGMNGFKKFSKPKFQGKIPPFDEMRGVTNNPNNIPDNGDVYNNQMMKIQNNNSYQQNQNSISTQSGKNQTWWRNTQFKSMNPPIQKRRMQQQQEEQEQNQNQQNEDTSNVVAHSNNGDLPNQVFLQQNKLPDSGGSEDKEKGCHTDEKNGMNLQAPDYQPETENLFKLNLSKLADLKLQYKKSEDGHQNFEVQSAISAECKSSSSLKFIGLAKGNNNRIRESSSGRMKQQLKQRTGFTFGSSNSYKEAPLSREDNNKIEQVDKRITNSNHSQDGGSKVKSSYKFNFIHKSSGSGLIGSKTASQQKDEINEDSSTKISPKQASSQLKNPYQDLDSIISKARSQPKVALHKQRSSKEKSSQKFDSANRLESGRNEGESCPEPLINSLNSNTEFNFQKPNIQQKQNQQFMSEFQKQFDKIQPQISAPPKQQIFVSKNKKKSQYGENNQQLQRALNRNSGGGSQQQPPEEKSGVNQQITSWRNFNNVGANQRRLKPQQQQNRQATLYIKKDQVQSQNLSSNMESGEFAEEFKTQLSNDIQSQQDQTTDQNQNINENNNQNPSQIIEQNTENQAIADIHQHEENHQQASNENEIQDQIADSQVQNILRRRQHDLFDHQESVQSLILTATEKEMIEKQRKRNQKDLLELQHQIKIEQAPTRSDPNIDLN